MIIDFLQKLFDKPKPVVVSDKEALKLRLIANSNAPSAGHARNDQIG